MVSPLKLSGVAADLHLADILDSHRCGEREAAPLDAVGHFVVAVVRHAVAAVGLDLQDAGVGSRRRGTGIRVSSWAPVPAGTLAEGRGVHLLELRVASLAHGEQAAGLLVLASYFLQGERTVDNELIRDETSH